MRLGAPLAPLALLALLLVASAAAADPVRYALVVGQNAGEGREETLRYAETDAQRMRDVLADLGGFLPENVVLLQSTNAEAMRSALIRLNERIRTSGGSSMLVVFYSGHADATALHLGGTELALEQLEGLVRGSAASFRLLVVDACRSGALTRVKGGTQVPAAPIELAERLPADGMVFWTSSSANEDAQESDEIGGSFFTHYLVSGLVGAADDDKDGTVTLEEAYRHAYEGTLRASSRTLAGVQHATFRHETHGMADIVLTTLAARDRTVVSFPAGSDYLLFKGGAEGSVVAEVGARDVERRVSLRPGRYFVRGRGPDHLLEGAVVVRPGPTQTLDERTLDRVEYARLVRKGGPRRRADSVEIGYTLRTPLWSGASVCQGLAGGWAMDFPFLSVALRAFACRGTFANPFLSSTNDELGGEARVVHAWDFRHVSLGAGALGGASALVERFDAMGAAPARTSAAAHVGLTGVATLDLSRELYFAVEVDALTTFFFERTIDDTDPRAVFSVRGNVLVGKRF